MLSIRKWSLVKRIISITAFGWFLFLMITIFTVHIFLKNKLIETHFYTENQHLDTIINRIENVFELREETLKNIAPLLIDNNNLIEQESIYNVLQVAQLSGLFEEFVFLDENATAISQYPYIVERENVNYSDRIFIDNVIKYHEFSISAPILGRVTGLPSIFLAQPVLNDENELLGILTARVALDKDYFFHQISNEFVRFEGELMIVDLENNIYIAATDKNKLMKSLSNNSLAEQISKDYFQVRLKDGGGQYWLYNRTDFKKFDWAVINITPEKELIALVRSYTVKYLCVIIPLILFSAFLFTAWIYKIFMPMREALNQLETNLLKKKSFSVIPVFRMDEVGKLLTAINELQVMRDKQEKSKDDLLSLVTHEIRTPLTAIRASMSMLSLDQTEFSENERKHLIEMSLRNSDRLLVLINDLLDLSSLANHKFLLNLEIVNISEIVQQSVDEMLSFASNSNVKLNYTINEKKALCLVDKFRLQQVLLNLISNAIKFSDTNKTVQLYVSSDNEFVYISVSDEGIGIPIEFHETVFERFTQVDSSDTRRHTGTGLGLAIAKELIELMKGEISLESEVGVGTTVSVKIPIINKTV